jgi:hypothetical protein
MADLSHVFGSDLTLGPTGDLAVVSGPQEGLQRVLRRLLTNPGGYIWNLTYGAGLPAKVGQPVDANAIQAIIQTQMLLEPAVAKNPLPIVTVSTDNLGTVYAAVTYADADTGQTQVLTVPLTGS